ncbi:hypothetical protein V6N13_026465 [Hibiscus sabdariffa]|uniref:Uncharacterized protein n=2 Tax=Hibiscus sabdariffa TaxID=183260 RepID=A0ABR2P749_9ROSI
MMMASSRWSLSGGRGLRRAWESRKMAQSESHSGILLPVRGWLPTQLKLVLMAILLSGFLHHSVDHMQSQRAHIAMDIEVFGVPIKR